MAYAHATLTYQLEERKKQADSLTVAASFEHAPEREAVRRRATKSIHQVLLMERNRRIVVLDHVVADLGEIDRRRNLLKRCVEISEVEILKLEVFLFDDLFACTGTNSRRCPICKLASARVEHFRRCAELLIRKQLANELRAWIFAGRCGRGWITIIGVLRRRKRT